VNEACLLVWYCGRCRRAYRTEPRLAERACKCSAPIPQDLGPTKVYGADLTGKLATTRRLKLVAP
jgi:hypothetical protein